MITTLAGVTRTFDLEPLAGLIRAGWIVAGGDVAAVAEDREFYERRRTFTPATGPLHDWMRVSIPITGPAVFAALDEPGRVAFQEQWEQLTIQAAADFDIRPLRDAVYAHWMNAMYVLNPDHRAQVDREFDEVHADAAGRLVAASAEE